jgi:hypothetical protein
MSFRLFIYYCTLAGAAAALGGWALGRALIPGEGLIAQGLKGLYLGLCLAVALALVDALWNFPLSRIGSILGRGLVALLIGALAGLAGGLVAQTLYQASTQVALLSWGALVLGYTLVGTLIGLSIGIFDLLGSLAVGRDPRGAVRKIKSGLLGGFLGGILGGIVSLLLHSWWGSLFADRAADLLWSPSATAFAALGACIGLMIGLAQVILKQAWLRVEAGFRPGRQQILTRDRITIGRAESSDVGLFGDPAVERMHAYILRQGNDFVIDDAGTAAGTYVNEERLTAPHVLRSGDVIRVGRCVLRFGERTRKAR